MRGTPRLGFLVVALAFGACGEDDGTVSIVTGEETDVFTRDPAPVTLLTETVAIDGSKKEHSRTPLPTATVDLGDLKRSDIGGIAITGLGADGKALVKGESLLVQWGALEAQSLQVFAQRTGELARVPNGPPAAAVAMPVMVEGRFILATNGTSTFLYDLLQLRTLSGRPTLPRPAKSLASFASSALLIDEEGASSFDLTSGYTQAIPAPANGSFAEVAGGARVGVPGGAQIVVGATRIGDGGPSARVLLVDAAGVLTFASLVAPREGACAVYVEGRGLVVYGGDAAASGAEVLAPGATLATPLPFPPDPIERCAATALDGTHVLVAGGDGGPARVLDLTCTTACAPVAWSGAIPLVRADAADLAPDAALVVGDDAAGATHVYRASPGELREVPLKNPRRGARLVRAPANGLAIVGGDAPGIEMYRE
ncbi:MAG: hypothetical protein KIT84_40815 [Labilithrix sp.]|nr:hypothetical protein [Labilithrix sp.]MCW5817412.1 hypothetical protein [Labilithrix sp.]